jgi:hypothetical protein
MKLLEIAKIQNKTGHAKCHEDTELTGTLNYYWREWKMVQLLWKRVWMVLIY